MAMDLPSFGSRWLGSRKQWDESLGQRLIPYGQAHKLKKKNLLCLPIGIRCEFLGQQLIPYGQAHKLKKKIYLTGAPISIRDESPGQRLIPYGQAHKLNNLFLQMLGLPLRIRTSF